MPITRKKKEDTVALLKGQIAKAKAVVFARFHGLGVAKISDIRRKFRAQDADYTVAKKTLIRIALKEAGKESLAVMDGEVALIAGYGDELSLFKIAGDFAKKEKSSFELLGGLFEGKLIDAQTAKALAAIPSREVLLAKLMSVLQGNTRKFVYVLDQMSRRS